MQRQIRRCALLLFPEESLNPRTVDQIVFEGFTDVDIAVFGNGVGRITFPLTDGEDYV